LFSGVGQNPDRCHSDGVILTPMRTGLCALFSGKVNFSGILGYFLLDHNTVIHAILRKGLLLIPSMTSYTIK